MRAIPPTIFISTHLSLDFVHAAAFECGPAPPAFQRAFFLSASNVIELLRGHTYLDLHRESLFAAISHSLHAVLFLRFTLWNRTLDSHPVEWRGLVSSKALTGRCISTIFKLLSRICSGTAATRADATQGTCYRREARCSSILNRTTSINSNATLAYVTTIRKIISETIERGCRWVGPVPCLARAAEEDDTDGGRATRTINKDAVQELICQWLSKSHCGGAKVANSYAGSYWICGEHVGRNVAEDGELPRCVRTGWNSRERSAESILMTSA
jgi:hypothetical protein